MTTMDDDTLRGWIAAADPAKPWLGLDTELDAVLDTLACAAPALAAEVLRLRERVARAERDAAGYFVDHSVALLDFAAVRDAARAYRDATDVPDGDYDATRHADALAALNRVLGGGR